MRYPATMQASLLSMPATAPVDAAMAEAARGIGENQRREASRGCSSVLLEERSPTDTSARKAIQSESKCYWEIVYGNT